MTPSVPLVSVEARVVKRKVEANVKTAGSIENKEACVMCSG